MKSFWRSRWKGVPGEVWVPLPAADVGLSAADIEPQSIAERQTVDPAIESPDIELPHVECLPDVERLDTERPDDIERPDVERPDVENIEPLQ
jgi:hypothetical protein